MLPEVFDPLTPDVVHVWRIAVTATAVQTSAEWLSPVEHERAERFVFDKDRHQFVVARGTLRRLLGTYLQVSPSSIQFTQTPTGKPLLSAHHYSDVHFNVSHSREMVLLAFTRGGDVGIDVEYMRNDVAHDELACSHFSEHEQAWLNAIPSTERLRGFFHLWTAKESYIKMAGGGLSIPLQDFTIVGLASEAVAIPVIRMNETLPSAVVFSVPVEEGYVGAVSMGEETQRRLVLL